MENKKTYDELIEGASRRDLLRAVWLLRDNRLIYESRERVIEDLIMSGESVNAEKEDENV